MKNFILNRFKEPSTWAGVFLIASAWGLTFTPEQQYALTTFGVALMGTPDKQHR
jgi:hypothetical protein